MGGKEGAYLCNGIPLCDARMFTRQSRCQSLPGTKQAMEDLREGP